MQNNRSHHASRFFLIATALAGLALAGCSSPAVTNLTAPSVNANPSQIYTITARIKPQAANVVADSTVAKIIIDGNAYKMSRTPDVPDVYEFEYHAKPGVSELRYYFLVEYQVSNSGILGSRTDYSTLQTASIIGRSTVGLTANRGPAGARVAVTGRGFTSHDSVYFDDKLAQSVYDSPNSISFYVPNLEPNRNYNVSVGDAPGKMPVGSFRIDPGASGTSTGGYTSGVSNYTTTTTTTNYSYGSTQGTATQQTGGYTATVAPTAPAGSTQGMGGSTMSGALTASPTEIRIRTGQTQAIKFITPHLVQGRAMLIDVTTDIPESVIMPEVYVQVGSNVGSVTIEGGRPGSGNLYAKMPGSTQTLTIPVVIKGNN